MEVNSNMERKARYSLFPPNPPSSIHERSPSPTEPPTPFQESSTPLQEPDPSTSPEDMDTPPPSSPSDSSLKPPSFPSPPPKTRKRPKRVYHHNGIGGAGNYHKVIRDDSDPSSHSRSFHLSSLFGGTFSSNRKGPKKHSTGSYSTGSSQTGSSQTGNQALPLGAAEVIKRKIAGARFARKDEPQQR